MLKLVEKLLRMDVTTSPLSWISEYLSEKPQFVKVRTTLPDVLVTVLGHHWGQPYLNSCLLQICSTTVKHATYRSSLTLQC